MRSGNPARVRRAQELRAVENDAEEKLWSDLRSRRLNGYKFVRQWRIGPYYADFACREKSLVVEVDGSQHVGRATDRVRDRSMSENGWSVLRFWHVDVLQQRHAVLETIVAALDGRLEDGIVAPDLRYVPARRRLEE